MEFRAAYLEAMRNQAPRMFNSLVRSGAMDAHLKAKTAEAYKMFADLTKDAPKDASGHPRLPEAREAEEQVFALLIEFPPDESQTAT